MLTVAALFGTGFIAIEFALKTRDTTQYALAIDAGSSHSGFFLYSWDNAAYNKTSVVTQIPLVSQVQMDCEVKGGISSLWQNTSAIISSYMTCLTTAANAVPSNKIAFTPIFLRATAGMRVLNENNATAAEAVLNATLEAFSQSKFDYAASSSEILSGEYEGAYGWLTVNYVMGNLDKVNYCRSHRPQTPMLPLV